MSVTCYTACEHNEDDICMTCPTIGRDGRCESMALVITDEDRRDYHQAELEEHVWDAMREMRRAA